MWSTWSVEKLTTFAEKHPEFKSQLPVKHKVRDDGTRGFSSAVAMMAADGIRNDGNCIVQ